MINDAELRKVNLKAKTQKPQCQKLEKSWNYFASFNAVLGCFCCNDIEEVYISFMECGKTDDDFFQNYVQFLNEGNNDKEKKLLGALEFIKQKLDSFYADIKKGKIFCINECCLETLVYVDKKIMKLQEPEGLLSKLGKIFSGLVTFMISKKDFLSIKVCLNVFEKEKKYFEEFVLRETIFERSIKLFNFISFHSDKVEQGAYYNFSDQVYDAIMRKQSSTINYEKSIAIAFINQNDLKDSIQRFDKNYKPEKKSSYSNPFIIKTKKTITNLSVLAQVNKISSKKWKLKSESEIPYKSLNKLEVVEGLNQTKIYWFFPLIVKKLQLCEFKSILKLSKKFPHFSQYFFKYIFNTFEVLKNCVNFLTLECMEPLEINFSKDLQKESKFSIWVSFFPMMNDGKLFEIELSKSKTLLFYLQDSHFYIEMVGLSKPYKERNFILNDWNILGIFFTKSSSNTHKYEIKVQTNKFGSFTIKSSRDLVCKKIILKFDGKLEFLRIFNDIVDKHMLPNNQLKSHQNYSEVYCLNLKTNIYNKELINQMPETLKLTKNDVACFNIQNTIGSFYHFLPILETSKNPKNFEIFCRILSIVLSMNIVQIPLKPNMIKWFRKILSSNKIINKSNIHDSLFILINNSTNHPNFGIIFENLMLNIDFWRDIDKSYLIEYLECVKIGFEKTDKKNSYQLLDIFFNFFDDLFSLNYKKLIDQIYSYYFCIMFGIVKNVSHKSRFRILRDIISNLKDKAYISSEEFSNFLNLACELNWECNDKKDFSSILDSLLQPKSKLTSNKTIKPLLSIILINLKSFLYQKNLTEEIKGKLSILFSGKYRTDLSQALFTFFSNGDESSNKISEVFEMYTESLHYADKQEYNKLEPSLKLFMSYYKEHKSFRKVVCSRNDFPVWLINLIDENIIETTVKETIVTVFGIPDCLTNLDGLRKIFGFLNGRSQSSQVIEILLQIFEMIYSQSSSLNFIREILNLCEDVLELIPYEDLHKTYYGYLIILLVEKLETFDYNLNEVFKTKPKSASIDKKQIDIRCGGVTRQILIAVFYGLSLHPNYFLEEFLLNLVSKTDSKHKKKSFEIFQIHLFILTEWVEIFRKYEKENIELSALAKSGLNFFKFLQESEIMEQIKNQAKNIHKSKIFLKYSKSSERSPHFFKYANEEIRHEIETSGHLSTNLDFLGNIDINKSDLLQNKIIDWVKTKLSYSHKNIYNFCRYEKKFNEVEILFKGLSTLAINKTSMKYYNPRLFEAEKRIKRENRENRKSNFHNLKNYSVVSPFILSEKFVEKKRKRLEMFTGKIEILKSSKIRLRGFLDFTGKPMFFKAFKERTKNNSNNLRSDLRLYLNLKISDDVIIDQNVSCKFLTEKLDYEVENGFSKLLRDFDCEIIKVEESNFGRLSLKETSINFTSSSIKKPEISPIISGKNSKHPVFSSSALSETQSKQLIDKSWSYSKIIKIQIKSFVHLRCSLELYFNTGKSILINFIHLSNLKHAYCSIKSKLNHLHIPVSNLYKEFEKSKQEWIDGKLSNFDYILILNSYASRSFNNLHQYPIFPWILKDYKSSKINLNDSKFFRDLSWPVPAQTPSSYAQINESYENSKHDPAGLYHYGAHYSSGALVLNYLVRVEPFTEQNKILNSGSFDLPDRIFRSIHNSWKYGQQIFNDPKELIPEFFYLPQMFVNKNSEDFGKRQRGKNVNDVKLPKWADRDVYKFLFTHRMALESDYVSKYLNCWIDLVFGYKQQGDNALKKYNLFHPISYENHYFKIMNELNDQFKPLYYRQAVLFGQTPDKLFDDPHPVRKINKNKKNLLNDLISGQPHKLQTVAESSAEIIILHLNSHIFFIFSSPEIHYYEFIIDLGTNKFPKLLKKTKLQNTKKDILSLRAAIYKDSLNNNLIATAGYIDNIILIHDLSGLLIKSLDYHNEVVNCLIGGSSIISASIDSKIICWTSSKEVSYEGHISPVLSISYINSLGILVSSSDHLLLHNITSGKALLKIKEKFFKLFTNSLGFICAGNEKEVKIFYINGDLVRKYQIDSSSLILFHHDLLIYKESNTLQSEKIFESSSKKKISLNSAIELTAITYIEQNSTLLLSTSPTRNSGHHQIINTIIYNPSN